MSAQGSPPRAIDVAVGVGEHARQTPRKPALVFGECVRTYGEFDARANRLARAFRRAGVSNGDRVAVALHNSIEWFEALHALGRIGAQLVPLSYRAKGPEMAYLLRDSEASLLLTEPELRTEIERALQEVPLPEAAVWVTGAERPWRGVSFEAQLGREAAEPLTDGYLGGGYNVMIYTSGTTGYPKGIVRDEMPPERSHLSLLGVARMWEFGSTDVHLITGPLYHTAPSSMGQTHLLVGGTAVIMPRFDAEECLRLIERHRVTTMQMVPAMFSRLLALSDDVRRRFDLSSVRRVLHAAAPCPVAVKQCIIELFPPGTVWEFYGASEGGATRIGPDEWLRKPGSVGRPWPGLSVKILDDEGTECPTGEVGAIYVTISPGARFSYRGADEKNGAAFRGDLFTVGDMGYLDEDGYLFIADRKTDMIISGGANIYPAEVEQVLHHHPAVVDAAVLGVPDDEMGESVKAIVELRPGAAVTAEELIAVCRRDLAHYKCPRSVEIVAELPREPSGKVLKRVLRERYWAGRMRRI